MTWLYITLTLVGSYLIGGIPFGLIAGKMKGKDIRHEGSGNIGATNAGRVLGRIWFFAVFAMDAGKGLLCTWIGYMLMDQAGCDLPLIAAAGVLAGHFYSPYLNMQGGKGVATGFGIIFILTIPPWTWVPGPALCAVGVFIVLLVFTRMVSAASMGASAAVPGLYAIWLGEAISHPPNFGRLIVLSVIAVFIVARHAGNIKRMLQGTEARIGAKP
ncbi:MAG: glycerol-3-phosphate 1-O-acyltransferase PlsY [Planctomycetes bacterium]|nr:glycerol-3-phosphate 1-O-acyltransferase PlsY [Planctomycetota bacterium]